MEQALQKVVVPLQVEVEQPRVQELDELELGQVGGGLAFPFIQTA